MLTAAAVVAITSGGSDGEKFRPVGITTVFLIFLFAFFFKPSWGATTWIWTGEIFSMNVRNQADEVVVELVEVGNADLQGWREATGTGRL